MSSFETIEVTVKRDFVRVGRVLFLLDFALEQMVKSGVMDTSVVGFGVGEGWGVGDVRGTWKGRRGGVLRGRRYEP